MGFQIMTATNIIGEALSCGLWMFAVVSSADFICGFVHWYEDNYGNEDWPIIGEFIIAPNRLHHSKPRAFTESSWWPATFR